MEVIIPYIYIQQGEYLGRRRRERGKSLRVNLVKVLFCLDLPGYFTHELLEVCLQFPSKAEVAKVAKAR